MSLENPFASSPIENNNEVTVEKIELLPEEQSVVNKSIELHKAMSQYDTAFAPMVARGQGEQLSDIYGEKWKGLNEEYTQMYNALSDESKEKVREREREELTKLGLMPESKL